ncbi:hypothetical protein T4E_11134 [Trichinella pseudospiralis]|uniref:Uncharacterized protein n=1 Tax=Trichinella pseudospiralis TaxID=6337 RepID=A0A0V0XKP7_TRIPS|nr:hypothetical protein T4E_11134 [Trichinella pseudospiralis]
MPNRCLHRRNVCSLVQFMVSTFNFYTVPQASIHQEILYDELSLRIICTIEVFRLGQATNLRSQDRRLPQGKLCLQGMNLFDQIANTLSITRRGSVLAHNLMG